MSFKEFSKKIGHSFKHRSPQNLPWRSDTRLKLYHLSQLAGLPSRPLDAFRQLVRPPVGTEGDGLKSFTFRRVDLNGDKASVRVVIATDAEYGDGSSDGKQPADTNRTLDLVNDHRSWKVWRYASSEECLAEALANAGSDEERNRLIAQDGELVNVRLAKAILIETDRLTLQGKNAQALDLYSLARRIANQINEKAILAQVCIEALRRAELRLLNGDSRYQHPFYWAPLAVIGNGG